jgi:hypothetical protein
MQHNTCPHCEQADFASDRGARHLYPIWSVHCDACCRRVLAFYPDDHMSSMNMALIVGMKRGFGFVTQMQREIRDALAEDVALAA